VPLLAVKVKTYVPTGTVPKVVMIPFTLLILTSAGAPSNEYVIGNVPVAVTWKSPPEPFTTLLLSLLVITGATGAAVTVIVNSCDASGNVPLLTVIVNVYVPTGIVPAIDILPLVLSSVTSDGASADNEYVKGIEPVAVTLKVPPVPLTTLVLSILVIVGATGAGVTLRVKV